MSIHFYITQLILYKIDQVAVYYVYSSWALQYWKGYNYKLHIFILFFISSITLFGIFKVPTIMKKEINNYIQLNTNWHVKVRMRKYYQAILAEISLISLLFYRKRLDLRNGWMMIYMCIHHIFELFYIFWRFIDSNT